CADATPLQTPTQPRFGWVVGLNRLRLGSTWLRLGSTWVQPGYGFVDAVGFNLGSTWLRFRGCDGFVDAWMTVSWMRRSQRREMGRYLIRVGRASSPSRRRRSAS